MKNTPACMVSAGSAAEPKNVYCRTSRFDGESAASEVSEPNTHSDPAVPITSRRCEAIHRTGSCRVAARVMKSDASASVLPGVKFSRSSVLLVHTLTACRLVPANTSRRSCTATAAG